MSIVYVGSNQQVSATNTQSLLAQHRAVWCSPPRLRPWGANPQPNEKLWLLWRDQLGVPLVLGCGLLQQNAVARYGTLFLWTNTDIPGVRPAAQALGYGGGTGMSFLHLSGVHLCQPPAAVANLGNVNSGMNTATPHQVAALTALC
jgi:hypothetical protein